MKKRNFWPLLFIGIFLFALSMIIWTIMSAIKTPVHEDESFLSAYHIVDGGYNDIVESNNKFEKKYNVKIKINDKEFDSLYLSDVFLAQRAIEKKSLHKDIFKKGLNGITFIITDKNGVKVNNVKIDFKVTRSTTNDLDINLSNSGKKDNAFVFTLEKAGNWNITGTIETDDKNKGFFYIKSNATN
jgi:hypothetical protein